MTFAEELNAIAAAVHERNATPNPAHVEAMKAAVKTAAERGKYTATFVESDFATRDGAVVNLSALAYVARDWGMVVRENGPMLTLEWSIRTPRTLPTPPKTMEPPRR